MDTDSLQIMAGSLSALLFIGGDIPMLMKAYRTRNLASYSLSHLAFVNGGNLIYWFYISRLPFGPIWVLHSFYTLTSVLMLVWYLRYTQPWTAESVRRPVKVRPEC